MQDSTEGVYNNNGTGGELWLKANGHLELHADYDNNTSNLIRFYEGTTETLRVGSNVVQYTNGMTFGHWAGSPAASGPSFSFMCLT